MMTLNEYELRVLGALVEKQIATPDYYPLTLNALTNACNQKNHRDPVVSYDEATVARALDSLREKNLAYVFHGSDARVAKYGHTFPKAFDLSPQETAVMLVLMLRGPQTPGELRSRTPHLLQFESLAQVEETLDGLMTRPEPLVVRLPRTAGTKEARFAHLLGDDINLEEIAASAGAVNESRSATARAPSISNEAERVTKLETELAALRAEIAALQAQFAAFKQQFE